MQALLKSLDENFVGNPDVKRAAARVFYYQLLKLRAKQANKALTFPTSNLLIRGHTGSGKTAIVQHLADSLDLPLIKVNALALTPPGWQGGSIEEYLYGKYNAWGRDLEYAIIYIDEIDKLIAQAASGHESNVAAHSLQTLQYLYVLLESTDMTLLDGRGNLTGVTLQTDNMVFIFSGVFAEQKESNSIGFTANLNEQLMKNDLKDWGVPKEFLGRISYIVDTHLLTEQEFKQAVHIKIKKFEALYKDYVSLHNYPLDLYAILNLEELYDHYIISELGMRSVEKLIEMKLLETLPDFETLTGFSKGELTTCS